MKLTKVLFAILLTVRLQLKGLLTDFIDWGENFVVVPRMTYRRGFSAKGFASMVIGLSIGLIIFANVFPSGITAIQNIATGSWNFTGYAGVIAMIGVVPLMAVAKVVMRLLD